MNVWQSYLNLLTAVWDMHLLPRKVQVRYRWYRRYWRPWYKTYPWHVTVTKFNQWTLEAGRHWRTERIYLVWWKAYSADRVFWRHWNEKT